MTENCAICLEQIYGNNFVRTHFCKCNAIYHKLCLDNHYNIYHNCPTCRKDQNLTIQFDTNVYNYGSITIPHQPDNTRRSFDTHSKPNNMCLIVLLLILSIPSVSALIMVLVLLNLTKN